MPPVSIRSLPERNWRDDVPCLHTRVLLPRSHLSAAAMSVRHLWSFQWATQQVAVHHHTPRLLLWYWEHHTRAVPHGIICKQQWAGLVRAVHPGHVC